MKVFILMVLLVHTTTATIDLQKLKETAATKLETISNTAKTLHDAASMKFQQFVDTIDFDKVHKLDILGIIPKVQYKGKLIKDTYENIPEYSAKVKSYLQKVKGLTKKNLALAFEAPWQADRKVSTYPYPYATKLVKLSPKRKPVDHVHVKYTTYDFFD